MEGTVLENKLNFKKGKAYNLGELSVSFVKRLTTENSLSFLCQRQECRCLRLDACFCSSSGPLMKDLLSSEKQNKYFVSVFCLGFFFWGERV